MLAKEKYTACLRKSWTVAVQAYKRFFQTDLLKVRSVQILKVAATNQAQKYWKKSQPMSVTPITELH